MLKSLIRVGVSICLGGLTAALFLFFSDSQAHSQGKIHQESSISGSQEVVTPTIFAVAPSQAPNNIDHTIVISGVNFEAVLSGTNVLTVPQIALDNYNLPSVGGVNSAPLTSTVPWGLDPGVYTLTVSNPNGAYDWLTNAFSVEQAIGVWTSGGPYGG
jgi:hypothetical protein